MVKNSVSPPKLDFNILPAYKEKSCCLQSRKWDGSELPTTDVIFLYKGLGLIANSSFIHYEKLLLFYVKETLECSCSFRMEIIMKIIYELRTHFFQLSIPT